MTANRRGRLRALLPANELDALLVTSLVNVRYLTGFTGSYGQLLLTDDPATDVLVTDGRYTMQVAAQAPDLPALIVPSAGWLTQAVGDGARVGLETHAVTWAQVRRLHEMDNVEVVAAPPLVEQLRMIKDTGEIELLRTACAIADEAFEALLSQLHPGLTEKQVAVTLERLMVDLGADDAGFETIVASGPNSAVPHHRPTQRQVAAGDLVTFDFGARVGGYHSDMTRMVSLGEPGAQLRDVFDLVRGAQLAGLEAAHSDAGTGDVDAACREVITAAGHDRHFVHGTGHGIGLQIHEDPYLRPQQAQAGVTASASVTLRPGMTVTVEPGVYLPGVGGVRIEDSLVITPTGPDVLTRTPKDLVVLYF